MEMLVRRYANGMARRTAFVLLAGSFGGLRQRYLLIVLQFHPLCADGIEEIAHRILVGFHGREA